MTQNIFSRPNQFDGAMTISTVEDVLGSKPDQFWLNVPVPLSLDYHQVYFHRVVN